MACITVISSPPTAGKKSWVSQHLIRSLPSVEMTTYVFEFYVLAVAVGLVQGGVQSLSRSFYAKIIPATKSAEFFGFYNMLGKFAAVIGPLLMGWVSLVTGNPRAAILSISLLFLGGAAVLFVVNEQQGYLMAEELEQR